ncbi:hypothetical protein [Brevundimonas sp. PWP3-1b1]|uniref:hypothetical protein n=1 Tax=unclassified Brevundimonas TaxID=2622653 RepID=UPI003CF85052
MKSMIACCSLFAVCRSPPAGVAQRQSQTQSAYTIQRHSPVGGRVSRKLTLRKTWELLFAERLQRIHAPQAVT